MNEAIKVSAKHIRRSPYQALAAVFIISLTFFVATLLSVLAYASYSTLRYFETRPQIIVFLKSDVTSDDIALLQKQLEENIQIKDVRYVSKEQALVIYKEATADNPLLSELVSPKVFPASLEFSVTELSFAENLIREMEVHPSVDQVAFTASLGGSKSIGDVINNLRNISRYVQIGGLIILSFLSLSSLLILLVILSMRISSRRDEIEILQLIGATPGFIRAPFVFEAIFYTVFGSLLGWILGILLVLYATPFIVGYFGEIPVLPSDALGVLKIFGAILGAEVLLAMFLGVIGSSIATKRYLKI